MGAGPLGIYERSSKKDILVLDDLVDALTFGNVPQVKTALTTVLFALAIYQVAMMSVGYGKVRVPFSSPKVTSAGDYLFGGRWWPRRPRATRKQVLWSLLAAAVITVATIALVTAKDRAGARFAGAARAPRADRGASGGPRGAAGGAGEPVADVGPDKPGPFDRNDAVGY